MWEAFKSDPFYYFILTCICLIIGSFTIRSIGQDLGLIERKPLVEIHAQGIEFKQWTPDNKK